MQSVQSELRMQQQQQYFEDPLSRGRNWAVHGNGSRVFQKISRDFPYAPPAKRFRRENGIPRREEIPPWVYGLYPPPSQDQQLPMDLRKVDRNALIRPPRISSAPQPGLTPPPPPPMNGFTPPRPRYAWYYAPPAADVFNPYSMPSQWHTPYWSAQELMKEHVLPVDQLANWSAWCSFSRQYFERF